MIGRWEWGFYDVRVLIFAVLLLGLTAGGADRAQSQPRVDWSGFYVGGNVGAAIAAANLSAAVPPDTTYFDTGTDSAQVVDAGSGKPRQGAFTGGVVAGYNVQYGNILLGLEAGANAFDSTPSRSVTDTFITDRNILWTLTTTVKSKWMATLRPRLGWAHDKWLVYATGGVALTQVKLDVTYDDNNIQPGSGNPGAMGRASTSVTKLGFTLGAGGEYALSPHWSLTGQYLYTDFGSVSVSTTIVPTPTLSAFGSVIDSTAKLRMHLLLAGANYRF